MERRESRRIRYLGDHHIGTRITRMDGDVVWKDWSMIQCNKKEGHDIQHSDDEPTMISLDKTRQDNRESESSDI